MNELIKEDFLSLDLAELQEKIVSYGFPKYRAKQIFDWMYKGKDFSQMINLPEKMREFLAENAFLDLPVIQKKLVSGIDGTAKYLLRLSDGNYIESVLMRYKYGLSICVQILRLNHRRKGAGSAPVRNTWTDHSGIRRLRRENIARGYDGDRRTA